MNHRILPYGPDICGHTTLYRVMAIEKESNTPASTAEPTVSSLSLFEEVS